MYDVPVGIRVSSSNYGRHYYPPMRIAQEHPFPIQVEVHLRILLVHHVDLIESKWDGSRHSQIERHPFCEKGAKSPHNALFPSRYIFKKLTTLLLVAHRQRTLTKIIEIDLSLASLCTTISY